MLAHWCQQTVVALALALPSGKMDKEGRKDEQGGEMKEQRNMETLHLNHLPDLPQQKTIREVATALWQQQEVIALWLGGSLACGAGDAFSDIDFRVAVAPSHLSCWEAPSFERVFPHTSVVGQQFLRFGAHAFLHHLVLSNGELFDLYIQSAESELTPEPHQILGCRSDLFARKLAQSLRTVPVMESHPPIGEALRSEERR